MNKTIKLKTADGFSICAINTISKGDGPVLWLHGIGVDKDEYLNFFRDGAQYLSEFGIDSLRIDFRGHGNSSGTSLDFSISGQNLDVDSALHYLSGNYAIEKRQLTVVGASFGAPPAISAAYRHSKWIKHVILISPVLSYKRTFLVPETDWAKSIFNKEALSRLPTERKLYLQDDFAISETLVEEMRTIDPVSTLEKLNQRIVLIHGDADSMVPYDASFEIAKRFPEIEFIPMKGMDHGFMDQDDEAGIGETSKKNKLTIYRVISECIG